MDRMVFSTNQKIALWNFKSDNVVALILGVSLLSGDAEIQPCAPGCVQETAVEGMKENSTNTRMLVSLDELLRQTRRYRLKTTVESLCKG